MTTISHHEATGAREQGLLAKHYFLLRRLHSLSGIVPIGLFLFPHLFTNSSIMWARWTSPSSTESPVAQGVRTFQEEVDFIHSLPFLTLIEVFGIWLPLAFHAVFGVYFASQAKVNVQRYAYQDNWRYVWQRITGYVAFAFIFVHVSSLRWGWTYGGLMPSFDAAHASSTTAAHLQHGVFPYFNAIFYAVCVLALVYHFANGLWTAAITWGLTISKQAQQRWGYVCAGVGIALAGAGLAAVVGFSTLDPAKAAEVETKMLGAVPGGANAAAASTGNG